MPQPPEIDGAEARRKAFERAAKQVADELQREMAHEGIGPAEAARRLGGVFGALVTWVLNRAVNPDLRTLSDLAYALGCRVEVRFRRNEKE